MINKINKLPQSEFIKVFANIFENARWIAEVLYNQKPFDDFEELSSKILNIFETATKEKQLKILNAHPDLANKTKLNSTILNNNGRADKPLVDGTNFKEGQYELVFFVGDYFKKIADLPKTPFLNEVVIRFGISNPKEHYHVPLLVSPWSYSTYRGN